MCARAVISIGQHLLADNPALLAVAVIGFSVSFETISRLATAHQLPGPAIAYPVLVDVGLLAMITESRRAIADGRSDLVPRALAWALIGLTLYVNVHGSPAHDWLGRALHMTAPALWAALLELTRWRKIARKRAEQGRDRIPLAHWLAAPVPTLLMWRRMVLRHITSYAMAVELEDARRLARDLARAHYGWRWKQVAPRSLTARIRTGRLGDDVQAAAAKTVAGDWDLAVRAMVARAVTAGDTLTVTVRQERRRLDRQDDRQKQQPKPPRKPVSASAARRARVAALLLVTPPLSTAQITAKSGASESTILRVKREMGKQQGRRPERGELVDPATTDPPPAAPLRRPPRRGAAGGGPSPARRRGKQWLTGTRTR
jgi:hypothetical protein